MIKKIMAVLLIMCLGTAYAQQKEVPVFISGTDGYKTFRIPAIIALPDGDLLAFAEGRVNGMDDFGDIDMVMKRSKDKGKTWSPMQVVAGADNLQLSNPAPVVDLTDPAYPQGRIFLFYNTGTHREGDIIKGKGIKHCYYITSADGGRTWAAPVDITLQVHRPKQPDIDPAFNFAEDWRYYANTPGHVMQFPEGIFKGRIFIAANHTAGKALPGARHYVAHGYYTDDHGKTFHLGNSINLPGSNESIAAPLSGNKLMMNSRNQAKDVKVRIVSVSSDGGATWDTTYFDHQLVDAVCQGSILNIGTSKGKNILAFCNAADSLERDNLTLRISFDDGRTWKKSYVIYKGDGSKKAGYGYAAYSDIVQLARKKIGVLYEKDHYSSIVFTVVNWK
ncbi:exo-alpha-sialidase [Chitinophaga ginsengisegetis]|uniref:sialidase family protein n=1 Tax=Chitinophaga ginsengisegetis TaxID=393003 RepID=UPI000DB9292B|nr:sialidase family protein [Chitinophaga ginsengisegetis]MDR6565105.1 sialidase-1 [Chitinophaga ginsengisegetis]MDR6644832.1 sialidase-1 [Chitinophaga ginsengisegetis]MDR6652576.1 sialidase-1 [Chitinophaga ginsengisegetis]